MEKLKENTNKKYIVIFILFLIVVIIGIYVCSEKLTKKLESEYDVDAELVLSENIDYKSMLQDYQKEYTDELKYIEYKILGLYALPEPNDVIVTDKGSKIQYENGKDAIAVSIIGLDSDSYNNYVNKLNANVGDIIIYNFERDFESDKLEYQVFQTDKDFKLNFVKFDSQTFDSYRALADYIDTTNDETLYSIDTKANITVTKSEIYDNLDSKYILADRLPEGFKEIKSENNCTPTIFVSLDKFNEIKRKSEENEVGPWKSADNTNFVKIKCNKIKSFSKYIKKMQEEKGEDAIQLKCYSLEK